MQEWANLALETARVRGATFADARVVDIRLRDLSTKNGEVGTLSESESLGIGRARHRRRLLGLCLHRPADARRR